GEPGVRPECRSPFTSGRRMSVQFGARNPLHLERRSGAYQGANAGTQLGAPAPEHDRGVDATVNSKVADANLAAGDGELVAWLQHARWLPFGRHPHRRFGDNSQL